MADEEKGRPRNFQEFCRGIPCAEMIRQVMAGGEGNPAFKCAEMMSRMRQMGCGSAEKSKGALREPEENRAPKV